MFISGVYLRQGEPNEGYPVSTSTSSLLYPLIYLVLLSSGAATLTTKNRQCRGVCLRNERTLVWCLRGLFVHSTGEAFVGLLIVLSRNSLTSVNVQLTAHRPDQSSSVIYRLYILEASKNTSK